MKHFLRMAFSLSTVILAISFDVFVLQSKSLGWRGAVAIFHRQGFRGRP